MGIAALVLACATAAPATESSSASPRPTLEIVPDRAELQQTVPVDLAAVDIATTPIASARSATTPPDPVVASAGPPVGIPESIATPRSGFAPGQPGAVDGRPAASRTCADGGRPGRRLDVALTQRRQGWLRGDLTDVVDLPDRRRIWLFGDTYWGRKRSDGGIEPGWTFTHSSAIVEEAGCFTPIADAHETGWIPDVMGGILWPHQAVVVGEELVVFAAVVVHDPDHGPPGLDFRSAGGAIVRYDLDALSVPQRMRNDVPSIDDHPFTRGVTVSEGHLYAYAHVPADGTHLARFDVADSFPATPGWEFWDGRSWSPDLATSRPVSSDMLRVWTDGERWRALSLPLSGTEIIEYAGAGPSGPFEVVETHPIPATTEPGVDMWSYEPLHVGVDRSSGEFAYNVLAADPDLVHDDLERYGPRFIGRSEPRR